MYLLDSPHEPIINHFCTVYNIIDNAINEAGSVLVHCHEGISRAPTLCASYLIKKYNLTNIFAIDKLKTVKPNIDPNPGFINQLEEYSKTICSF